MNEPEIVNTLNQEQMTAYRLKLIRDQMQLYFTRDGAEQLLFNLQGGPGTGKSQVIKAITEVFTINNMSHLLIKAAYTGIADSVIDGITLHSLAHLPTSSNDPLIKL